MRMHDFPITAVGTRDLGVSFPPARAVHMSNLINALLVHALYLVPYSTVRGPAGLVRMREYHEVSLALKTLERIWSVECMELWGTY